MTHRPIPLVDLAAEWQSMGRAVEAAVLRVVRGHRYILGPEVRAFEEAAAEYLGVRHAVGVSCGTDALVCALGALGVGSGDEVLTTAFSFFATVEAILRVGATPRFADVDPTTLNIEPSRIEESIGPLTRAVLVVHLYGRPANMDRIMAVCAARGVPVIEDAAQAFGVTVAGRAVGSLGILGCFSFFPAKPFGGIGDGGLVVTNDDGLAEVVRSLRVHGARERNEHTRLGGNYRLDAIQAAGLSAKLPGLSERLVERKRLACRYDELLAGIEGLSLLGAGRAEPAPSAVYTVRVDRARRDAFIRMLDDAKIGSAVYYPRALTEQPLLVDTPGANDVATEAVRAARQVVALPFYFGLTEADQDRVVATVRRFFDAG